MLSVGEYYKSLPKKRVGAGALIFNDKKELLIVKPHYKDYWSIPGGTVDANESPKQACIREVKEEIDLNLKECRFLCVDYVLGEGDRGEAFQFIFYGGVLSENEMKEIKLTDGELTEYKFVKPADALPYMNPKLKRISKCLEAIENNTAFYLENGI